MDSDARIRQFLQPFQVDLETVHQLSGAFFDNFRYLAAHDAKQFLPTPISESILRTVSRKGHGRHLAIDIGGTNLRVGFIELSGEALASNLTNGIGNAGHSSSSPQIRRLKERSWPIADHLKCMNATKLFDWIGSCIVAVVEEGCRDWRLFPTDEIPLGITFSFPMDQNCLSQAMLMPMGKGFSLEGNVELGALLLSGYEKCRGQLPPVRVTAIANDSVSTLVSLIFMQGQSDQRKGCLGLIVGTGCNATIPLKLRLLHESKRPTMVRLLPGESIDDVKIAVNTEWSINGTAPPLRKLGLVTPWDAVLDAAGEIPGFQPLEYMTAGRYLGELGRLVLVDFMEKVLGIAPTSFPPAIKQRNGLATTFSSKFRPLDATALQAKLEAEFPSSSSSDASFQWTTEMAAALYHISKAIEVRAAGIVSAGIIALLKLAEEIPDADDTRPATTRPADGGVRRLGVGYTGGCIVHFQDYLQDTQHFLDELIRLELGDDAAVRVELSPCHDGGIKGAGILAAAALASQDQQTSR